MEVLTTVRVLATDVILYWIVKVGYRTIEKCLAERGEGDLCGNVGPTKRADVEIIRRVSVGDSLIWKEQLEVNVDVSGFRSC